MSITRLFLARHGQVTNHHEIRFNGHFNVDITQKGIAQMENLAAFLKLYPVEAIYSSDLIRTYRGADIIANRLKLKSKRLSQLRELSFGRWEGLTMDEMQARYPEEAKFRYRDLAHYRIQEGGENLVDLNNRVIPVIDDLLKSNRGKNILIVAHGGVNRAILCHTIGLPLKHFFKIEQDFGCLNVIDYFSASDGERFEIVKMINGGPNQEINLPITLL